MHQHAGVLCLLFFLEYPIDRIRMEQAFRAFSTIQHFSYTGGADLCHGLICRQIQRFNLGITGTVKMCHLLLILKITNRPNPFHDHRRTDTLGKIGQITVIDLHADIGKVGQGKLRDCFSFFHGKQALFGRIDQNTDHHTIKK